MAGNFNIDLTYRNYVGGDGEELPLFAQGHSGLLELGFSDEGGNVDLFAKGVYEYTPVLGHNWIAGGGLHWYPIQDNQDLRLFATAGWSSLNQTVTASLGLSIDLNIKLW